LAPYLRDRRAANLLRHSHGAGEQLLGRSTVSTAMIYTQATAQVGALRLTLCCTEALTAPYRAALRNDRFWPILRIQARA